MKRTELRLIFACPEKYTGEPVKICGWLRTSRNNKSIGFIELNDGTCFANMQVVYEEEEPDVSNKSRILEGLTNNIGQTILGRAFAGIASVPLALAAALNLDFLGGMSPNLGGIIVIVLLIGASIAWPPAAIAACGLA